MPNTWEITRMKIAFVIVLSEKRCTTRKWKWEVFKVPFYCFAITENFLAGTVSLRPKISPFYRCTDSLRQNLRRQLLSNRSIRELRQPRRRRQQKPHKFAYLTMKNRIFARFARAFFSFWHFEDVLVLSTTWNDLFCSPVEDVSIWWQMFNFVFLCPKRWF